MFEYTGSDIIRNLKDLYANFAPKVERISDGYSVAYYDTRKDRCVVIGDSGFVYMKNVDKDTAKKYVEAHGEPAGASYVGRAVDVMRWLWM